MLSLLKVLKIMFLAYNMQTVCDVLGECSIFRIERCKHAGIYASCALQTTQHSQIAVYNTRSKHSQAHFNVYARSSRQCCVDVYSRHV